MYLALLLIAGGFLGAALMVACILADDAKLGPWFRAPPPRRPEWPTHAPDRRPPWYVAQAARVRAILPPRVKARGRR